MPSAQPLFTYLLDYLRPRQICIDPAVDRGEAAHGSDVPMLIDRTEDRAGPHTGDLDPIFERLDRAEPRSAEGHSDLSPRTLLISLRAAQVNDGPLPDALNV
jgi:hypothetical protein